MTPVHRWSPIPDTRNLDPDLWNGTRELRCIDLNEAGQLDLVTDIERRYADDVASFPMTEAETTGPGEYYVRNGTFETVDGEVLYYLVRECEPETVIQMGGGFSTRAIARAIEAESLDTTVEVFEPYRDDWLERESPDDYTLNERLATDLDPERIARLEPGDILFVDSTHVVRTGNDMYRLMFDLIPRLPDGVLVHFHDIFLPKEYPRDWVENRGWALNEQYFLHSFLMFNERFEVRWLGQYMHERHSERLASVIDSYDPSQVGPDSQMFRPNSLWLEVNE